MAFKFLVALSSMLLVAAFAKTNLRELQQAEKLLGSAYSNREKKLHFWTNNQNRVKSLPSVKGRRQDCIDGKVTINNEDHSCRLLDFESFLGIPDLTITRSGFTDNINELSDIWGWLSPSGKEITILCMTNGVRFIDSTDPENPINLALLPSNRKESYWCDVKVHKDVAFIVKDRLQDIEAGLGIQVFDLTRLESLTGENNVVEADLVYDGHGSSHNVVVNTETEFIYTVGNKGDSCNGGLHMIDVSSPLSPTFVGCAGEDGYIHDAQCVVYDGPDATYTGKEICFGFNEDTVTIYDVSVKSNVQIISKSEYTGHKYTHQGWLTTDMTTLLIDDELDEYENTISQTRTYIMDVSDLSNPVFTGFYDHPSPAIDHNLYVWGAVHAKGWGGNPAMSSPPDDSFAYCANYASGVRVLDITQAQGSNPKLKEVGHFDVSPDIEVNDFFGSWSTYMHPSGTLAISGIERGLYLVTPRMAFGMPPTAPTLEPTPVPSPQESTPSTNPVSSPVSSPTTKPGGSSEIAFTKEELVIISLVSGTVVVLAAFTLIMCKIIKSPVTEQQALNAKVADPSANVAHYTSK